MARSKYEIRAQKELEADGWAVDTKAGMGRFSKNRDYFHMFDLLAYKPNQPLRFISVKGKHGNYQINRRQIEAFTPTGIQKELWRYDKDPKRKNRIRLRIQIVESTT